jgi:heme/copper-type cytochrome/quinol oxidase subunit 1
VARLLFAVARLRDVEPATFGIGAAGVIYLIALLCFLMAWFTRPVGFDAEGLNEYLMWGGGHILQFTNTALFLCCLFLVTRVAFGETALSPALFKAMMLLMVAGAAAGPLLYLTYPGGDPTQRVLFTNLYWYALPVPSAVIGVSVLALLMRRWHDIWAGAPEVRGAAAALLLFGFGGVIGFFESSVDTRTPGHYHAVLIAVTIVFMALTLAVFLPILGRRSEQRRLRTVIYLTMAVGTLVQSIGLFAAGVLGVARKTAGAEQGLDSAEKMFAMLLNGIGGGVAAIGGIIFIVMAGKLLLAKPNHGVTAASLTGAGHH